MDYENGFSAGPVDERKYKKNRPTEDVRGVYLVCKLGKRD
jgi:hypothetical protein